VVSEGCYWLRVMVGADQLRDWLRVMVGADQLRENSRSEEQVRKQVSGGGHRGVGAGSGADMRESPRGARSMKRWRVAAGEL
jgi:hypothetical protein